MRCRWRTPTGRAIRRSQWHQAPATAGHTIAESFDYHKNNSPSPDELAQTLQALAHAHTLNVDGSHDSEVMALTSAYDNQQAQASDAYRAYHANTVAALAPLHTPLQPPPTARHGGLTGDIQLADNTTPSGPPPFPYNDNGLQHSQAYPDYNSCESARQHDPNALSLGCVPPDGREYPPAGPHPNESPWWFEYSGPPQQPAPTPAPPQQPAPHPAPPTHGGSPPPDNRV